MNEAAFADSSKSTTHMMSTPPEKFFVRGDKISIMAALIDSTILGIGILVGVLWQSTISNKPAHPISASWSAPHATQNSVAAIPTHTATPTLVTRTVCTAFVTTTFADGQTHAVEYRGKCSELHGLLANSKLPVRWLAPRTYTYTLGG